MGLLGYCPGTSAAACGKGRKDAILGVLGQLTGGLLFVVAYLTLEPLVKLGDFGKITLHEVTHTSPWLWVSVLAIAWALARFVSGRSRKNT